MTTKYVQKSITVPVTLTWDATEESDETGADIMDVTLVAIDVDGFAFDRLEAAMQHLLGLGENNGEWEHD